jgi:myo-inositol-1(or 4)-monophosphatase
MQYSRENTLMQSLLRKALRLRERNFHKINRITQKGHVGDVASSLDYDLDELLVEGINKAFPHDSIMSEESAVSSRLHGKRLWIIDPLCGSLNAVRRIPIFVTNVALAENDRVVAAWVLDYVSERIVWSIGDDRVYSGQKPIQKLSQTLPAFRVIEINWGYREKISYAALGRYGSFFQDLLMLRNIRPGSIASSLSFLYVATGQIEAAVTVRVKPWDIAAAAFLVQQNGGVVTQLDSSAWHWRADNALLAKNRAMHKFLLRLTRKHRLLPKR